MNDIHNWPSNDEQLWGSWMWKTGLPKASRYRNCVHPDCDAVQEEGV